MSKYLSTRKQQVCKMIVRHLHGNRGSRVMTVTRNECENYIIWNCSKPTVILFYQDPSFAILLATMTQQSFSNCLCQFPHLQNEISLLTTVGEVLRTTKGQDHIKLISTNYGITCYRFRWDTVEQKWSGSSSIYVLIKRIILIKQGQLAKLLI